VWHEFGMCHARQKQWEPALEILKEAVEVDPENRLYAHSYAYCLARARRFEQSYLIFAKLDGEANAHYNLARMLLHMQQEALSKEHLRLALAANPDLAAAQQLLTTLNAPQEQLPEPIATTGSEDSDAAVLQVLDSAASVPSPPAAPAKT